MIKCEYTSNNKKAEFPIIAVGKRTGCVVAFTADTVGVVLKVGNSNLKQFVRHYDLKTIRNSDWNILRSDESITLRNF